MEAFTNITGISPDADPSEIMAMMAANTDAVQYSNQALQASNRGDYSTAIELHQKALKMKVDAFGTESVQAAITYNGLGENYLKMGHLDAAESAFEKALRVRDTLGMGPANDAAATRDNMGQLYEAKGPEYFEKARAIRLKGAANGQTMCGNENCMKFPGGTMLNTSQLMSCGACKSVFYCSPECQKADWRTRHKPLCKAHTEWLAKKK